jgi:hypothetical protein
MAVRLQEGVMALLGRLVEGAGCRRRRCWTTWRPASRSCSQMESPGSVPGSRCESLRRWLWPALQDLARDLDR